MNKLNGSIFIKNGMNNINVDPIPIPGNKPARIPIIHPNIIDDSIYTCKSV